MIQRLSAKRITCVTPDKRAVVINSPRPEQNGRHFSNDIFNPNSLKVNVCVSIQYLWTYDKPLLETMHDDVVNWKHFPRYWPFVRRIHRPPVNSPHKGQSRGALMFTLICAWMNDWVYTRQAGDLRRHRAHHDVTVMMTQILQHLKIMREICIDHWQDNCQYKLAYW